MDFSTFYPPAVFVHFALLFYVLGFLVRDSFWLRILVLCGTAFYILYYYFISDEPLWDAIFASMAIAAANFVGIYVILKERSTIGMSAEMKETYALFPTLKPGQFRQVIRCAREHTVTEAVTLCQEGRPVTGLFLIKAHTVVISRGGKETHVGAGNFIGELSFLLDRTATATVIAPEGTVYFEWDRDELRALMNKSSELSNGLVAMFNEDLAAKLAVSWPDTAA